MGYLILQTILLLLVTFVIGCIIGCWLRRMLAGSDEIGATPSVTVPLAPVSPASGPAAAPAASLATAAPAGDGRPGALDGPRGGQKDDLKRIKGVGRVNEGRLNELGIYHFDQIATWGRTEVDWVDDYLTFKGRIDREKWVQQAKVLARGDDTEFSKRVDSGDVSTSKGRAKKSGNMKKR